MTNTVADTHRHNAYITKWRRQTLQNHSIIRSLYTYTLHLHLRYIGMCKMKKTYGYIIVYHDFKWANLQQWAITKPAHMRAYYITTHVRVQDALAIHVSWVTSVRRVYVQSQVMLCTHVQTKPLHLDTKIRSYMCASVRVNGVCWVNISRYRWHN